MKTNEQLFEEWFKGAFPFYGQNAGKGSTVCKADVKEGWMAAMALSFNIYRRRAAAAKVKYLKGEWPKGGV